MLNRHFLTAAAALAISGGALALGSAPAAAAPYGYGSGYPAVRTIDRDARRLPPRPVFTQCWQWNGWARSWIWACGVQGRDADDHHDRDDRRGRDRY